MSLNPPQQEAVEHISGPLLILAGPGSGKTRVLVHRVAHLIESGVAYPSQILAVTFTNKAADEMRRRLETIVGPAARELNSGTFHSICLRLLRRHSELAGFGPNFLVYDESDQLVLIKECMMALNIDKERLSPKSVVDRISRAKDACKSPSEFSKESAGNIYMERIASVYERYQKRLNELEAMDFGDLIRLTVKMFDENPTLLENYRQRWRYIMVDEYQDTNNAQYRLITSLARGHGNLCVVGDDDQCLTAGTLVTMADGPRRKIERICEGDEILSCYGSGDFRPARVSKVFKNNYEGEGIVLHLKSGRKLVSTSKHMHFAGYRLGIVPQTHFTYLMQKRGIGWRLGTSQVYTAGQYKPMVGFKQRLLHEHADALWIVGTHQSENEARVEEYILSLKYQLPMIPFVPRVTKKEQNGIVHDERYIRRIFKEFDTEANAMRLLADRGLTLEYPHHRPRSRNSIRRNVVVTLCGDRRGRTPMHLISIVGNDADGRAKLEALGFSVRMAKRGSRSWRFETANADFSCINQMVKKLRTAFDVNELYVARLGAPSEKRSETKSLPFLPASSVMPGMVMFSEDGSYDIVERVEKNVLREVVYDLNIERTHNFLANGIVTHNSIYKWRGADISNILRFEKDFPGAKVIKLEQNYRSTTSILEAAQAVVSNNVSRKPKKIWTENPTGSKVSVISCETERREAELVANRITKMCGNGRRYNDFAIFYRTNAQSRPFEDIFRSRGVSYRIFGGVRFYERAEVKDILAYLKLIVDPNDDVSLRRIINIPARGIGKTTVDKLLTFAQEKNVCMFSAIHDFTKAGIVGAAAARKLTDFVNMIEFLSRGAVSAPTEGGETPPLQDTINKVLEKTGYVEMLASVSSIESEARLENINELVAAAKEFSPSEDANPLIEFLDQVTLVSGADSIDVTMGSVTMMTLHLAKGLEFPVVFMVGLEEGLFPHSRSQDDNDELEEERRLCYVGMTRAKEDLFLTHAFRRQLFGSERYNVASRFLDEIPKEYVVRGFTTHKPRFTVSDFDQRLPEETTGSFAKGARVKHPSFGFGQIASCERTSSGHKVTVQFQNGAVKRLIAEFAGLILVA